MSKRDWKLYIDDILESIGFVEMYLEGMDLADFGSDRKTIDAVVRNFEIIGEASKYIPVEVKERHSQIDWPGIVGLRNRIAHEYFDVSPSIIWEIAKSELPALKKQIKRVIAVTEE